MEQTPITTREPYVETSATRAVVTDQDRQTYFSLGIVWVRTPMLTRFTQPHEITTPRAHRVQEEATPCSRGWSDGSGQEGRNL